MLNHVFISFATVQRYDLSYIHLYDNELSSTDVVVSQYGRPILDIHTTTNKESRKLKMWNEQNQELVSAVF